MSRSDPKYLCTQKPTRGMGKIIVDPTELQRRRQRNARTALKMLELKRGQVAAGGQWYMGGAPARDTLLRVVQQKLVVCTLLVLSSGPCLAQPYLMQSAVQLRHTWMECSKRTATRPLTITYS